jgi:hypothetical protein
MSGQERGSSETREAIELAGRIATRLGEIEGVEAVALGGSRARGEGRPGSDVDLGLYYRDERRPSPDKLDRLLGELGYRDRAVRLAGYGEWGPWIDGGAWLQVERREVDVLLRNLDRVESVITDCRAGRVALDHQPGHPHGFHSHIYMAEVHHCLPLFDPERELARLKALTEPYPPPLKRALVRGYLWQAGFALDTSRKSCTRGDVFHAVGSLFQCAASLVQVLHALNERYFVNEKGAVAATDSFKLRPEHFAERVSAALGHAGETPEGLLRSHEAMERLVEETRAICTGLLTE